ncbi:MAG: hypothetical protein ACK5FG_09425 [Chryseotalea sp.]|nr:hypothetical protein [Cytophagales bacterium]
MLSRPFLARCNDRNSLPASHPTSGSPEDWFSNENLAAHGLHGISFDFFVNWDVNPITLTPVVWIKRVLGSMYTYTQVIQNIGDVLTTEFGVSYLNTLKSFSNAYNLEVQFIVFRDDLDWSINTSEILLVNMLQGESCDLIFTHSLVSIESFKTSIRANSGGPVRIGPKGLIYGTSNLECYLSGTDSLYPGDVDMVILDFENRPVCILEFKKHTLGSTIENQRLSNYYPNSDRRKYDRLAVLRDLIGDIPIFIFYYPTRTEIARGKCELIGGVTGNLSARGCWYFDLPINDSKSEIDKVINCLSKGIAYHNEIK